MVGHPHFTPIRVTTRVRGGMTRPTWAASRIHNVLLEAARSENSLPRSRKGESGSWEVTRPLTPNRHVGRASATLKE